MKGTIKVVFFFGICLFLNDWSGVLSHANPKMSVLEFLILPLALFLTYIVFKQIKNDGNKVNMVSFGVIVIVIFHLLLKALAHIDIPIDTPTGGVIFIFLLFIIGLPASIIIANKVCSYMKEV